MATKCCIPDCGVNQKDNSQVNMYNFPDKGTKCYKKWIESIQSLTNTDFTPTKCSKICQKHFEGYDFFKTRKTTVLRPFAVPLLFYPKKCATMMTTKMRQSNEYPKYFIGYNENHSINHIHVLNGRYAFTMFSEPKSVITLSNTRFFFTEGDGTLFLINKGGAIRFENVKKTELKIKITESKVKIVEHLQKNYIIDLGCNTNRIDLEDSAEEEDSTLNPYIKDDSHCFIMYDSKSKTKLEMYKYYSGTNPIWIEIFTGKYCFIYYDDLCIVQSINQYVYSIKGKFRIITLETGAILCLDKDDISIRHGKGNIEEVNEKVVKKFEDNVTRMSLKYRVVDCMVEMNSKEEIQFKLCYCKKS